MNAAMLSVSCRFYKNNPYLTPDNFNRSESYVKAKRTHFFQNRIGLAFMNMEEPKNRLAVTKKGFMLFLLLTG